MPFLDALDEIVERGCGRRKVGGVYAETGVSPDGAEWLLDPPIPVPNGLVIPTQGVAMIQQNGVWHIIDRIGTSYYPNVADFVEEVWRYGLSRRIARNTNFSLLTPESKIFVVHPRAIIRNWTEYKSWSCPNNNANHSPEYIEWAREQRAFDRIPVTCAGVWWRDLVNGTEVGGGEVEVTMPSFSYRGHERPQGVRPDYADGIFGVFPIGRLVVVSDEASEHVELYNEIAGQTTLPVEMVNE